MQTPHWLHNPKVWLIGGGCVVAAVLALVLRSRGRSASGAPDSGLTAVDQLPGGQGTPSTDSSAALLSWLQSHDTSVISPPPGTDPGTQPTDQPPPGTDPGTQPTDQPPPSGSQGAPPPGNSGYVQANNYYGSAWGYDAQGNPVYTQPQVLFGGQYPQDYVPAGANVYMHNPQAPTPDAGNPFPSPRPLPGQEMPGYGQPAPGTGQPSPGVTYGHGGGGSAWDIMPHGPWTHSEDVYPDYVAATRRAGIVPRVRPSRMSNRMWGDLQAVDALQYGGYLPE